MKYLQAFVPFSSFGIFLFAFLGFQLAIMNHLMAAKITPLEKNIARIETEMTEVKADIKDIKTAIFKIEKKL